MILELCGASNESYEVENFKKKKKDKTKKSVASFTTLALFKPVMKKALDKRGIKHSNKIDDIALKFYENIVKASKHYEQEHLTEEIIESVIAAIVNFIRGLKDRKNKGGDLSKEEQDILDMSEKVSEKVDEVKKEETESAIGAFFADWWWAIILLLLFLAR